MGTLQYEYRNLLNYLEKNKVNSTMQNIRKSKQNKLREDVFKKKKDQIKETKQVLEKTKEIVKSSKEQPKKKNIIQRDFSTVGFNVKHFEELMRIRLIDDYKRLQSYERPYISVSELYTCMRKNYYSRSKYPIDVRKQFNFSYLYMIQKVGNVVHEIVQSLYDFSETEKTIVSEKYKVKGRCDAIRNNFLYEIKTIEAEKFQGKYEENHYIQSLIYSYILNSEYGYNIDMITIIYVLRNLKKIASFDIKVSMEEAVPFLQRGLILRETLDKKEVPEPIGFNKDECVFCPYKTHCEKDPCKIGRPFDTKKLDSFLL